jgi:hypothetical protein
MWHNVKIMNYERGEMWKEEGADALSRDTEEKHKHHVETFSTRRDFEPDPSINANYITPSTYPVHAK